MSTRHVATCENCTWTGTYRTAGYADYALRRHSCDKQSAKDAATARRTQALAAIDRTPKPCRHKQANHQHGTYACYVLDACRCAPCCAAQAAYERNRIRQHAYGRWDGLVDAQPARDHIKTLTDAGMGLKRITAQSGISGGMLTKLIYGTPRGDGTRRPPARRIKPTTEAKILAVTLDLADAVPVNPTGTARRLQALACNGWSINALADRAGIDRQRLDGALAGSRIHHGTATIVVDLFEQLWDVQAPPSGSATRTRNRAAAAGWAPAMAWDDGDLDDPAAVPDTGEPDRTPGGKRVHIEDVEHLLTQVDYTRHGLADRLGITWSGIERALHRAERTDLIARLNVNTYGQPTAPSTSNTRKGTAA